ncbi:hypothetical protein PTKIN_Ptkin14bG0230000 [Pterospermum kingtungense]
MGQTPSVPMWHGHSAPAEWHGHSGAPDEWCGHHSAPHEWYVRGVPSEWPVTSVPSVPSEIEQTSSSLEIKQTPSNPEESCDDFGTYLSNLLREKGIETKKFSAWTDTKKEESSARDRLRHVPSGLQTLNESDYEPKAVLIGPRHRHKMNNRLQQMEGVKKSEFEKQSVEGKAKSEAAVRGMEEDLREWYGLKENPDNQEEFIRMMKIDGCFVILLLLEETAENNWVNPTILLGDLLLFENQLPLFLLEKLYGLYKDPEDRTEFAKLAWDQLKNLLPDSRKGTDEIPFNIQDTSEIYGQHLLGLVHHNWILSRQGFIHSPNDNHGVKKLKVIRCAKELEEAGITFKDNDGNQSLFDVEFDKDGKMKIPKLVIDEMTERVFLNLIAYEIRVRPDKSYVLDYARLMFNLVKTADDVKLLRLRGFIQNNMLADDEAVASMLKKLVNIEIPISEFDNKFSYHILFDNVNKYCGSFLNHSMATFRHNYFSTPWKRIGLIAAILGFLFALVQVIVSFLK